MFPVDVIEYKEYSFSDLILKFQCDEIKIKPILKYLNEKRIINKKNKQLNSSESIYDEIQMDNFETSDMYVFTYVGIILLSEWVIKCYPKYLDETNISKNALTQVIRVLKKYKNSKEENLNLQEDFNENSDFNLLSIMIELMEDYYKNGLYTNFHKIIETNGLGEILWDKTINETNAFIQNNKPYYLNFYTKKRVHDTDDYFKLLHEVILTRCSEELENADILDYFDLIPINLSNKDLDDFGDDKYIESKINQELNIQFNSHKQSLLKKMLCYIKKSDSFLGDANYIKFYGTNSYQFVWEEMCSQVFNNKRDVELGKFDLPNGELHEKYSSENTLGEIIERPTWFIFESGEFEGGRLKPDIISFNRTGEGMEFIIMDAKYYNWESNRKPGVGDIIKQYIYERAYKEFIKLNGFIDSKNCFLFPSNGEDIVKKGYIEFKMLKKDLGLKYIQIILLPASMVNQYYLENDEIDISCLGL